MDIWDRKLKETFKKQTKTEEIVLPVSSSTLATITNYVECIFTISSYPVCKKSQSVYTKGGFFYFLSLPL